VTDPTHAVSDHEVTLSVAVNSHAEGRLLRPTLRSVAAALTKLASTGVSCELIIVLDNATSETRAEAHHWRDGPRLALPIRVVEAVNGDAGESRNSATREARGRYLAFCDGDDIVTSNYFAASLKMLAEAGGPMIVHPETVVSFGERALIWHVESGDSVDYRHLLRGNVWPSSSVSQRETYLNYPYAPLPREDGFGPEDWLWNIETAIAGIPHRTAPGTIFFYRVRASGGVNNGHKHSILPRFDLDGLILAMPRRSAPVAQPQSAPGRSSAYLMFRRVVRTIAWPLSVGLKQRIRNVIDFALPRTLPSLQPSAVKAPPFDLLKEAAWFEPAISWPVSQFGALDKWETVEDGYGDLLVGIVNELKGSSRAIVTVPWVGIGGADLVSLNYARALSVDARFNGEVSMLATYLEKRTHRDLVPEGVNFVQVPAEFLQISPALERRLLAQALILAAPELVISVNCFHVTNSMQLYGRQMASTTRIYLTLFAWDSIDGFPTNPITDDGQRGFLDSIGGVLADNTVTAATVQEVLALTDDEVRVHHQPAVDRVHPLPSPTAADTDALFSVDKPFRVLWPHRLDREKRPDALVAIANLLDAEGLPVQIDVFGQQVLSNGGTLLVRRLEAAGVRYKGPYSDGLASLPTHEYHALILTSESEGLPLVLVQSMLLGLPVIATAVGGVTDLVKEGATGLLVGHPDDAEAFVKAIRVLMGSLSNRRRIISAAYSTAAEQHDWHSFTRLVDAL